MPRYIIERTFPEGISVPVDAEGVRICRAVVTRNAEEGATWVHSYVSDDRKKSFCVFDAPSPEAVRRSAARTGLPVDRITEVRVLDPYFFVSAGREPARRRPPSWGRHRFKRSAPNE